MAVITLANYKTWVGITGTDDDGWLAMAIASVDRAISGSIGVDLSSSADTVRTYDLVGPDGRCLATNDETRLRIPGGIRAFTKVEVSNDGTTWTEVTTEVRVGPLAQYRPSSEPGDYIEFKPYTTAYGSFAGYVYVRITGTTLVTFGWSAWPDDLVQAAYVAVQRMSRERDSQGQYLTETNALRYLDKNLLNAYRWRYFAPAR